MKFYRPQGYPPVPAYPQQPPMYPGMAPPYPGSPYAGQMMPPPMYPPPGGVPPGFGYYAEPIEYYAEAPEYGYYGEPLDYAAVAEAPEYGYYGEMEPVGYYAESPELVGWGVGEDPSGMGCTCNKAGSMHGYSGYGRYVAEEPPRSIPNVVAATNLNEYMAAGPEYGEPEYGEPEYSEAEYGEPEYGEPEYGEASQADYGETEYGGYVAPADVSPTCSNFTSPPVANFVPEHFRPLF